MSFGIFVGINNHGKTIMFGCALLRNETRETFRWLMKKFVSIMGKPPITILTDQDPWLTEAIGLELPSTKHSFCIWHITSKFSGWFLLVLRRKYFEWFSEFYRLYRLETIEESEHEWPIAISKYKLNDNSHINGLYDVRTVWVPAFLRDYFFGGMTTTGRSESINAFVKRFINSHITLRQFLEQLDLAVETIRQKEAHDSMLEKHKFPILKIMSPLEGQFQKILTPYAYEMFREELGRESQYEVFTHFSFEYILRY
ncbi:protein FAR1-RELATED SEQUENCE 11-like [Papaver somniferum]|uniref:protein FAR1-RELATED SEQUENCE 11-like n=1 Tax=Papaver somniferum TaxID=3469 RepID=UPI000E6FF9ED|nr:protein FAR1-RELATED SEQUENCE 11-like [Papaver somniferum]